VSNAQFPKNSAECSNVLSVLIKFVKTVAISSPDDTFAPKVVPITFSSVAAMTMMTISN
jgi:hypothetical protein